MGYAKATRGKIITLNAYGRKILIQQPNFATYYRLNIYLSPKIHVLKS